MPYTWTTTLTTTTDEIAMRDMRDWLHEAGDTVPRRDGDVLAKYLACVIHRNSESEGVPLRIAMKRPRMEGFVSPPWASLEALTAARAMCRRRQFALDCFALLVMLTMGGLFWFAHWTASPHHPPLPVSYN